MDRKPINQVVAEALQHFMGGRSNVALAKAAGVSEGTIRNVLNPTLRGNGARGKEPSVKVTELALIAAALHCEVSDLVTDATPEQRDAIKRQRAADYYLKHGTLPSWAPTDDGYGKRDRNAA